MFLRKMRRRKDGKVHTYWALVESVRMARGPRQRVVAHLGELSPGRRVGFERLGQELEGRDGAGQLVLYGDNPLPEWVRVDASRVQVERVRSFGQVWLLWEEWRRLGLEDFFRQQLRVGKEQIRWGDLLAYRVVAQVAAPSSELAVVERFVGSTALADLLGIDEERIDDNRLLRLLEQGHLDERSFRLILGDGAPWIWNLAEAHFPGVPQLLDFYHAAEHLHAAAEALWPEATAHSWWQRRLEQLRSGQMTHFFASLQWLAKRHHTSDPAVSPQRLLKYFEDNRDRLNYCWAVQAHLPIGSGQVESAARHIVQQRLKQSGMRWSDAGAQAILNLRTLHRNGDFEQYWETLASNTA